MCITITYPDNILEFERTVRLLHIKYFGDITFG